MILSKTAKQSYLTTFHLESPSKEQNVANTQIVEYPFGKSFLRYFCETLLSIKFEQEC